MPPKDRRPSNSSHTKRRPSENMGRRGSNGGPPSQRKLSQHATGRRNSSQGPGSVKTRSRSPVFWGCVTDTYFYSGPLGEPVGEVSAGAVVLESQRYLDPFGNCWVSTRSTDGSVIWLSMFDAGASLADAVGPSFLDRAEPRPAMWKRVFDSRAENVSSANITRDSLLDISIDKRANLLSQEKTGIDVKDLIVASEQIPSMVNLIEHFWSTVNSTSDSTMLLHTNWNLRYQMALENYLFNKNCKNSEAEIELKKVQSEFETRVFETVGTILEDMMKPTSQRKVKQHPQYSQFFYEKDGVVIQMGVDSSSGALGGEASVEKIMQSYFKSHRLFSLEGPKQLLYVPLMCSIRYNGYLFLATTVPPINSKGCVYGAPFGELEEVDVPNVVTHSIKGLSASFNLSEHEVQFEGKSWKTSLPLDLRVYVGKDRRMYLINTGRLLPSIVPLCVEQKKSRRPSSGSETTPSNLQLSQSLRSRVRPELFLGFQETLNPDVAVSKAFTVEDLKTGLRVTEYLRGDGSTKVSGELGLQFSVDAPVLPTINCALCDVSMENEMRFLCCSHVDRCCSICAQCYTKRMYEGLAKQTAEKRELAKQMEAEIQAKKSSRRGSKKADESRVNETGVGTNDDSKNVEESDHEESEELYLSPDSSTPLVDFSDVAKCGQPRKWPTIFPSISTLFHINGINMSFLPFVYYRLPTSSKFAMKHFLEIEIIARAATKLLNSKLKGCTTVDTVVPAVEKFYVPLLQERTPISLKFWAKELGPEIVKAFPAVAEPFDTSALPVSLLVERIQQLSGIYLTSESLRSIDLPPENRFLQIDRIEPILKTSGYTFLERSEDDGDEKIDISAILEKMLLFWIGYAPKDSVEALQPYYLDDNFTAQ